MKAYIALLRGINVGGHKKVSMIEFRDLLTKTGFQNVQTYIQSGNVVFQSSIEISKLEKIIQKSIYNHFGFEVSVIIKTNKQLQVILDNCPLSEEKKEKSYFIMLNKIPDSNLVKEVDKIAYENEEIIIKNDCIYFCCSTGYGRTKFNMNTYERKLNVVGTSRNYKTMVKLLSLSAEN
ncbi:uncharacterized protein (DUF1697 family) [Mariniflexile fucanivorans]|uniref:Uncharacterized protein (DUF1697 family) n=1 Tax=Mariniflexile fucanivorans TaxID=264023 RepID=A0A4R1RH50_9FLAO|nr:DUF1697 domain-containing protein [Mariniflexile fucanivorans]TCL65364.1 uncharacterized protein (DUF1697 family) [Mariniflexile fucanivorans]